ncbi:MAG: RHS repeat-associated core domain-containing protein, partial [Myxococcota bacterium]
FATELDYALNGNSSGYVDPARRVHQTRNVDGATPKSFYFGDTTRMIDGLESDSSAGNHVVERIDVHGRLVERRLFAGAGPSVLAAFDWRYDGRDRKVEEWFGGNPGTKIRKRYDLLGRLVETEDPNSGIWRRVYDAAGNTLFADDPAQGQSIHSCYDALDRIFLQCARSTDVFDANLCETEVPSCDSAFVYEYDATEALTSTLTGEAIPNWGKGQLSRVVGPDSTHFYAYDLRRNRTARVDRIEGVEATTEFSFSSDLSRLQGMTYPDGERVRLGYDIAGQPNALSEVDSQGAFIAPYVTGISYDLRGRPIRIQRGNYTEDVLDYHGPEERFRLARIRSQGLAANSESSERVFFDLEYRDYDGNMRITELHDGLESVGPRSMSAFYDYDGAGRLVSVAGPNSESFEYDALGSMARMNGRLMGTQGHQLLWVDDDAELGGSGTHMAYDANGHRVSKTNAAAGMGHVYAFNAFGQLQRVTVDGISKTFGYDHEGLRVSEWREGNLKRFFGASSSLSGGSLTKYYHVGDQLIATRSDPAPNWAQATAVSSLALPPEVYWVVISSAMVLLCVPLGRRRRGVGSTLSASHGVGAALIPLAGSLPLAFPLVFATGCVEGASIRHYHMSHLGSPVAITQAGGDVERVYRYSAFGEVRRYDAEGAVIGIDSASQKEFAGYETDPESGLQYAGARYFDPATAQFLSLDPAEQFASPYAYAGWDPVNLIDPDGRTGIDWMAYGLVIVALALALANAVTRAVQTGSAGVFFQELATGVASVFVGYMSGFLLPNPAIGQLAVSLGTSTYAVVSAKGRDEQIFAGIGLATTILGSAFGFYRSGSVSTSTSLEGGQAAPAGFGESQGALSGVEFAGAEDANIAALPGRALVRLNNMRIETQIADGVSDLRARAFSGEFDGLDVAAFEVRTTRFERELGVTQIVSGSVTVVARPPGFAGFPHALAPKASISPIGTLTTVSPPILIRSEASTRLLSESLSDMLLQRGVR